MSSDRKKFKVILFSAKSYDRQSFTRENEVGQFGLDLTFVEARLDLEHVRLAKGFDCVVPFVNCDVSAPVIQALAKLGVKLIAIRSAGFNNIDIEAAKKLGIAVARVPKYSPHAVAEHTVTLMLALNRKIHKAYARTRDGDFSLDGLLGFDMHGRTAGVIGTGKIGVCVISILKGFGCKVLASDPYQSAEVSAMGVPYVALDELYAQSDIITLHCPLLPSSHHMIDAKAIEKMKKGVMIINTGRGPLLHTKEVIDGIKSGKIGALGVDVYENEGGLFFDNHEHDVLQDDTIQLLRSYPNVLMTAHQAFFTREALEAIAQTTLSSASHFEKNQTIPKEVTC